MTFPTKREELRNYAGQWTDAKLNLDYPDGTKFIIGKEGPTAHLGGIPEVCVQCNKTTYLSYKDKDVVRLGAIPLCSDCYLKSIKKK